LRKCRFPLDDSHTAVHDRRDEHAAEWNLRPRDANAWEALPVARQEQVIGRTKDESVELDDKPAESHVGRTDQDEFGKIFRRNMPYGTVTEHGTIFVGFSSQQQPLTAILDHMAALP